MLIAAPHLAAESRTCAPLQGPRDWSVSFTVKGPAADGEVSPADGRRVGDIRQTVDVWMGRHGLTHLRYEVLVVVSELVTNAVKHAAGPGCGSVSVTQRFAGGLLRTEVRDTGSEQPRMQSPAPDCESGRGLSIVSALTEELGGRWGFDQTSRTTWCEIPANPQVATITVS
ncbi:ATP-binding protein [Streptomyces sp. NPDC047718]|uniref:ATP-binding protein n=1 Tax=Streptomyces sp. NPDC047718 TaxID=3155479 RepID=UPI0033F67AD5